MDNTSYEIGAKALKELIAEPQRSEVAYEFEHRQDLNRKIEQINKNASSRRRTLQSQLSKWESRKKAITVLRGFSHPPIDSDEYLSEAAKLALDYIELRDSLYSYESDNFWTKEF